MFPFYDISHICAQCMDCGYSLEPPHGGNFNENASSVCVIFDQLSTQVYFKLALGDKKH